MGRVRGEIDALNIAHEMPVVEPMAVVVPQNPSIVHPTALQVDVCKTVCNNLAILEPDLLLKDRALALASEGCDLGRHGLNRARFRAH